MVLLYQGFQDFKLLLVLWNTTLVRASFLYLHVCRDSRNLESFIVREGSKW